MMIRNTALALSLLLSGTSAIAAPAIDQPTAEIRIGDLDLATAQGQDRLHVRLTHAARNLCRTDSRRLADRVQEQQCVAAALASARTQADRAVARAQDGTQLALLMVSAPR